MFKVECYVEDKSLGELMKRLTGLAKNIDANYVPNLESKPNGKIYQTAGDTLELLSKEIHKRKLTEISGPTFREIIAKMGMNRASYSHYLQSLVQAGVLKKGKKTKNVMQYIVTGK